jgi:hypothetical protein
MYVSILFYFFCSLKNQIFQMTETAVNKVAGWMMPYHGSYKQHTLPSIHPFNEDNRLKLPELLYADVILLLTAQPACMHI